MAGSTGGARDERSPDKRLLEEERCEIVRATLAKLTKREREAVWERYFVGGTLAVVGRRLGVTHNRIGQLLDG